MRKKYSLISLLIIVISSLCMCSGHQPKTMSYTEAQDSYKNSHYVLPFPVGERYACSQGRFQGGHNRFKLQNGQDFIMLPGAEVVAARAGKVYKIREDVAEYKGDDLTSNFVMILHKDGTYGRYIHLGENQVFVEEGQDVEQGEKIALTGRSGNIGLIPHLHFDVVDGVEDPLGLEAQTIPVWFKNTKPHPKGVVGGEFYTAEKY